MSAPDLTSTVWIHYVQTACQALFVKAIASILTSAQICYCFHLKWTMGQTQRQTKRKKCFS